MKLCVSDETRRLGCVSQHLRDAGLVKINPSLQSKA